MMKITLVVKLGAGLTSNGPPGPLSAEPRFSSSEEGEHGVPPGCGRMEPDSSKEMVPLEDEGVLGELFQSFPRVATRFCRCTTRVQQPKLELGLFGFSVGLGVGPSKED